MNHEQEIILTEALKAIKPTWQKWLKDNPSRVAKLAMASALLTDSMLMYESVIGPQNTAVILYQGADRFATRSLKMDDE